MASFRDMVSQSPLPSRLETLDARVAKLLAAKFNISAENEDGTPRAASLVARDAGLDDVLLTAEVAWLPSMPADVLIGATAGRSIPGFFRTPIAKKFYQLLGDYDVSVASMVFRWAGNGMLVLHNKGIPKTMNGVTMVFNDGTRTLVLQHLERYLDDLTNGK